MSNRRKIAVLVESSRGYGRGLLHGVATYVREHGPWTIHNHERRLYDAAPDWLKQWRGDGIIARISTPRFARQIARLRVPTVDLLGLHPIKNVPVIITDHRAVARSAADHLLERGLVHFAFCGFTGIHFSERRSQYFVEYLSEHGHSVSVYTDPRSAQQCDAATIEVESLPSVAHLAAWLKSLPKPVGLMAATDDRAHHVLNVCGEFGIAVPDEVAVIGVDNDEMLCDLCDPRLSSVALNLCRVGYEAAALLNRMMRGTPPPKEKMLIPPLGVVMRQSTDVLAISDADVAAAAVHPRTGLQRHCGRGRGSARGPFSQHVETAFRRDSAAVAEGRDRSRAVGSRDAVAEHHRVVVGQDRRFGRLPPRRIDVQALQTRDRHDAGPPSQNVVQKSDAGWLKPSHCNHPQRSTREALAADEPKRQLFWPMSSLTQPPIRSYWKVARPSAGRKGGL